MFHREKKDVPKLSDAEKDVKVASELSEARKCIEMSDNKCTVQHLGEAHKHEDCPPCKRQIAQFKKDVPLLAQEKQVEKIDLLSRYVQPATGLSREMQRMKAIKPSKTEKLKYGVRVSAVKVGGGLKKVGGGIKGGASWVKRKLSKPKEAKL